MFSIYPRKPVIQSIQDFDHLGIDPQAQIGIMRSYQRHKSNIACFHKHYFILQREHTLAKERLKHQQGLLVSLRKKYQQLVENKESKESIVKMCRYRIAEEESLFQEYQKKYEQVTKQNAPCESHVSFARTNIERVIVREVSVFEELKQQQRIVMYLASVTKEMVLDVALSRLQKTFQFLDQIQKRETQRSHSIQ